ncbi:MAG TPA: hypothetical protein VK923_05180 [Euzebyales bacterium]|nr:hypothetical protein [Euzebyales bacterium]
MVLLTLSIAAGIAVLVGALRPDPLLLAMVLHLLLFAVWSEAFIRHARHVCPLWDGSDQCIERAVPD